MNLFAYGSMALREVMDRLTGGVPRTTGAWLRGYFLLQVKGRPDGAIIPFPDSETEGVVYFDLDSRALGKLDAFAGSRFVRTEVTVQAETGEWVEAEAYVFRLSHRRELAARRWNGQEYRKRHLQRFLNSHPADDAAVP